MEPIPPAQLDVLLHRVPPLSLSLGPLAVHCLPIGTRLKLTQRFHHAGTAQPPSENMWQHRWCGSGPASCGESGSSACMSLCWFLSWFRGRWTRSWGLLVSMCGSMHRTVSQTVCAAVGAQTAVHALFECLNVVREQTVGLLEGYWRHMGDMLNTLSAAAPVAVAAATARVHASHYMSNFIHRHSKRPPHIKIPTSCGINIPLLVLAQHTSASPTAILLQHQHLRHTPHNMCCAHAL